MKGRRLIQMLEDMHSKLRQQIPETPMVNARSFQQLFSSCLARGQDNSLNEQITKFFMDNQTKVQEIIKLEKDITLNGDQEKEIAPIEDEVLLSSPLKLTEDATSNNTQSTQSSLSQVGTTTQQKFLNQQQTENQQQVNSLKKLLQQCSVKSEWSIQAIKAKYQKVNSTVPDQRSINCVCGSAQEGLLIQCRMCTRFMHLQCLGLQIKDAQKLIVCPVCALNNIDPMTINNKILVPPSAFHPGKINHKSFQFTCELSQAVEIRCIKIDGKYGQEEITWPDLGELVINGKRVMEFKPLQVNSCLKKRKDEKFNCMLNASQISLTIKENVANSSNRADYRIQSGQLYFVGAYHVKSLKANQFIDYVLKDPTSYMSINQSKDFLALHIDQSCSEEVQIDQLTVSLLCQIDWSLIKTPARGHLCEHPQCFSLENVTQMMESMSPRKWRCPICKSKIYKIQIDSYQLDLINTIKSNKLSITELSFDKQGELKSDDLNRIYVPNQQYLDNNNRILQLEALSNKTVPLIKAPPQPPKKIKTESKSLAKMMQISRKTVNEIVID